jgi:2-oxoglutarate ferredoxin oxidoreductase subunit beta
MTASKEKLTHPNDHLFRLDALPHIWCSGCGIGTTLANFLKALEIAEIPKEKRVLVSGIGCSSRVVYYAKMDGYHTTHGRSIPFATGLKLANPSLCVNIIAGDGDLFAIGGNHFIHAARRNMDLLVICINNFNYGMTGGQSGPTTPSSAKTSTTPYGNVEVPFNLPSLATACGAVYVARWTTLDIKRMRLSMVEAIKKKGFRFIEVISPCPVNYGKSNDLGDGVEEMGFYQTHEVLLKRIESPDLANTDITLGSPIVIGKFVDIQKPTFPERYSTMVESVKAKGAKR